MPDLSNWHLKYELRVLTAAEWGIDNLRFSFTSGGLDQCTFSMPGMAFDAARVFAYGASITIFKADEDGALTRWFQGEVIKPKVKGGHEEFQQYVLVGVWFALQETVYQQEWGFYLAKDGALQKGFTSHLVLNGTADGISLITTQQQITAVLNYILNQLGGVLQIGTLSLTALYPPIEEVFDLPAAEVILRQLKFHPEAVISWDYTEDPPKLSIQRYADLPSVDLAYPPEIEDAETYVEEVELDSREDLQRPAVAIKYEVRTTVDGRDRLQVLSDIYPDGKTGRERGSLPSTVKLSGGRRTSLSASIVTQAIPADLTDASALDWWKQKFPESLGDSRVTGIEIIETSRQIVNADGTKTKIDGVDAFGLPFELVAGQIADWMSEHAQREEVTIKCRFSQYDGDPQQNATLRAVTDEKVLVRAITTTDLETGDYFGGEDVEELGDPIPIGLAKALYDQLQILHYSGTFKLIEKELSGRVRPGMVVNIKGGRPEWETMKALVQQVEESAATGETLVTVGPPDHLSVQNIIDLLKVNRFRSRTSAPGAQADGSLEGFEGGALGRQTANADRAPGGEMYQLLTIKSGDRTIILDGVTGAATFKAGNVTVRVEMIGGSIKLSDASHSGRSITLDLADCVGGNADRALSIQETNVCEKVNGVDVTKKMLVLRSASY
jgi:hypothetical protein